MCGIAGILRRPGQMLDPALPGVLAAALAHRGPDGAHHVTIGDVTLVHTRLSIIDLVTGDQPLRDGARTLIANGEIYNYRELRAALPGVYATQSDCEPPLKLYAQDRAAYPAGLRGMYAIALHDADTGTLSLSRDLFGIKPLYVAQTTAGLLFASEPQALLAAGVPRALHAPALEQMLRQQFYAGTQSIFKGIQRVAPGETMTAHAGGITARRTLAFPAAEAPPRSEAEALTRLDAVLQTSVELHQRSDVPYGMFLSGGIDSAAILAMMSRLNDTAVRAYTAGFDVPGAADERDAAAATARAAGASHTRVDITEAMVWAHLPEIAACMDDPAGDYAIIPTWFLAQRARAEVKVILSGEGGDEMFAGYGRYRAAARAFFPKPMRARGIFDGLGILRGAPAAAPAPVTPPGLTRLKTAQRQDIAGWLPDDLLIKLDRCLMAHGVEGRTPLIDPGIAAFAFALPDQFVTRNNLGKYLLRLWLAEHLPAANPFGRKQGFDVPIGAWIAGQARALGPLVARQPIIAELTNPGTVPALFAQAADKRFGFAAWMLLFLALWHRRHVLALPAAGDVFETLKSI